MIYLVKSFDSVNNSSSPLSVEGVEYGKVLKKKCAKIVFDYCYTSYLLQDFSSAIILVGDRVFIQRIECLENKKSTSLVEKEVRIFLESLDTSKNILIVASLDIINLISDSISTTTIIN